MFMFKRFFKREGDTMKIPQIQITTNDIKMDWSIKDPVQRIHQPRAKQTISQPPAILEIHTTDSTLKIDSSQARSDIGMLTNKESIEKYAQAGKEGILKGISRRVQEGYQMMNAAGKDQGRSVMQSIAKQNTGPKRPGPYNIKFVPSVGSVKIDYTPGTTDVNITRQEPKIDTQVNKPILEYTPGKVTGTMIQRPSVTIDVKS